MNLETLTITLTLVSPKTSLSIWFSITYCTNGHLLTHQTLYNIQLLTSMIIFRDKLTAVWLSPIVSTRDPNISPRALAPGLIMVKG